MCRKQVFKKKEGLYKSTLSDLNDTVIDYKISSVSDMSLDFDIDDAAWYIMCNKICFTSVDLTNSIDISNTTFLYKVSFYNCEFTAVNFNNIIFKSDVKFYKCKFHSDIKLRYCEFCSELEFSNCTFFGDVDLSCSHFSKVVFKESTYKSECRLANIAIHQQAVFEHNNFYGHTTLVVANFTKGGYFFKNTYFGEANFISCDFDMACNMIDCRYLGCLHVADCKFASTVSFIESTYQDKASWFNCKFYNTADFSKSNFIDKLTFVKPIFSERANFNSTTFNKFDFIGGEFHKEADFTDCTFLDVTKFFTPLLQYILTFADSTFCHNFRIEGIRISQNSNNEGIQCIYLGNTTISSSSIVNICCNYDTPPFALDFNHSFIQGLLNIQDTRLSTISCTGAVIHGHLCESDMTLEAILDRETARILKHESIKSDDKIKALEYYDTELLLHKKDLSNQQGACDDKIILFLNNISNKNGRSPWRGCVFTFISSGAFYVLYLAISRVGDIYCWLIGNDVTWIIAQDIAKYIDFATSVSFEPLTTEIATIATSSNGSLAILQILFTILFYFLGKISIGYGVYQTITAFRKFNNK